MNSQVPSSWRRYLGILQRYLAQEEEAVLQQAYDLGRRAIGKGLGVLDMARIHHYAQASCLSPALPAGLNGNVLRAAELFFLESLSPFEAAHRGFRKANHELHQVNRALAQRNSELARINRQLEREVSQRKRTEKALRRSEDHYRVLFHQASLMQENLRHLSSQILQTQEAERKHVSRELHDEVGQALTAISTSLAMLQLNGHVDLPQLQRQIAGVQTLLVETMAAVHRFARELRPAMLDELGLLPALRSYLKAFAQRTGLSVHFKASAEIEKLDDDQKTVLFRVAQESLTNIARHSQATRVTATLRRLKSGVRFQIADNGKAFDARRQLADEGTRRLGLLGMQERVRLVSGRFAIHSAPGKGTVVRVEVPLRIARSRSSTHSTHAYGKNHRLTR
jgi:two-component system sensor histidine kinase DegS